MASETERDENGCVPWCPVRLLDEQAGPRTSGGRSHQPGDAYGGNWHNWQGRTDIRRASAAYDREASAGSASRFYPVFWPDAPDVDAEEEEEEGDHAPMAEHTGPADTSQPEAGQGAPRDQVICGDSREVLTTLPDGCADALVTDPPAGVSFMQKDWDGPKGGRDQWIAWLAGIMAEARRCVRPGGYALVWALPRTAHWTAMALEDSGWAIRDSCHHIFSTGFPKSRSCLKPAHETWWLAKAPGPLQPLQIDASRVPGHSYTQEQWTQKGASRTTGTTYGQHRGSETALPAGRWPPNTILSHHPDCRPAGVRRVKGAGWRDTDGAGGQKIAPGAVLGNRQSALPRRATGHHTDADGYESVDAYHCVEQCPVRLLDEQAGPRSVSGSARNGRPSRAQPESIFGGPRPQGMLHNDTGSASRYFPTFPGADPEPEEAVPYFYTPKASRSERNAGCDGLPEGFNDWQRASSGMNQDRPNREGRKPMGPAANHHPCVKPVSLARWLSRLICPPAGLILDPFAGSGALGVGAILEGFRYIGIEMDPNYVEIARARIAHAQQQRHGPLFANADAEKDA